MKIIAALLAYLIGSIPTGFIIFYLSEKKDIRNYGSQATGATNVLRLKGWKYGLAVFAGDWLKGFLPVLIVLKTFNDLSLAAVCAFLVVVGHCFPLYIKFKGGKGVATTVGIFSILALKPLMVSLVLFLIIVLFTRYVSLGSLLATLSLPVSAFFFQTEYEILVLGTAVFLVIGFRHKGNIKRLIQGKERKIGERIQ